MIILFLSVIIIFIIKKTTYLSSKQKEFIVFAINMYIEYAEELNIIAPEKHEYIVNQLKKIKEKNLNYEK